MHQTGKKLIQDIRCSQFTFSSYAGFGIIQVLQIQASVISFSTVLAHTKHNKGFKISHTQGCLYHNPPQN